MWDYGMFIVWVGILITLVPAFALFVYLARAKKSIWLVFVIAAVGWWVALFLRQPILRAILPWISTAFGGALASPFVYLGVSSLFAGLFEEGIRYGLMKKIQRTRADLRHALSFGLGWGFGEAVVIYAVAVVSLVYLQGVPVPFTSLFLGALERNMATAIHVGLTFLIFRAVTDVRFLFVAMGTHFMIDFVGISLLLLTGIVWATYGFALIIAVILLGYAYRSTKLRRAA